MPENSAGYLRFNKTIYPDASFNPTLKAILPVFPGLTPEERHRMLFVNILPSLFIVGRSETLTYNIFLFTIRSTCHPSGGGWWLRGRRINRYSTSACR